MSFTSNNYIKKIHVTFLSNARLISAIFQVSVTQVYLPDQDSNPVACLTYFCQLSGQEQRKGKCFTQECQHPPPNPGIEATILQL